MVAGHRVDGTPPTVPRNGQDCGAVLRFFALTLPGLGGLLREELADQLGKEAVRPVEHDGRSDVVPFEASPASLLYPRLAEALFAEIGAADRELPLGSLLGRLWDVRRYQALQPALAPLIGRLPARPGFRVVARLRTERLFLRSELRQELTRRVAHDRPRWRPADPARLELWALQTARATYRLGLRIGSAHGAGRDVERPGALRPAVAAAMVRLAGAPDLPLLDPCCGSGTIVQAALDAGRAAIGADLAWEAVTTARANLPPGTPLVRSDAAALPFSAGALGGLVCNPPFGRRHPVDRAPGDWLRRAAAEFQRVVAPGGAVVLLHPDTPAFRAAVLRPLRGRLRRRCPIRLLGLATVIWLFR